MHEYSSRHAPRIESRRLQIHVELCVDATRHKVPVSSRVDSQEFSRLRYDQDRQSTRASSSQSAATIANPDKRIRHRRLHRRTAANTGPPPPPHPTATAPPSPTTPPPKPGSPSAPTAPTSPPTTAATGAPSTPTPPSTTPPTPTSTGTPSPSPTPSAPTDASPPSAPPPSPQPNEHDAVILSEASQRDAQSKDPDAAARTTAAEPFLLNNARTTPWREPLPAASNPLLAPRP